MRPMKIRGRGAPIGTADYVSRSSRCPEETVSTAPAGRTTSTIAAAALRSVEYRKSPPAGGWVTNESLRFTLKATGAKKPASAIIEGRELETHPFGEETTAPKQRSVRVLSRRY
jgi:hypothetical protein